MGESFWQKDSLITHTIFELWLIIIFSPVANFGQHPLVCKKRHFVIKLKSTWKVDTKVIVSYLNHLIHMTNTLL